MTADDAEVPDWRRCEIAWAASLEASGHLVTRLMDAIGNAEGTGAPLIEHQGQRFRAPDLEAKIAGVSSYWEVKFRSRPEVNTLTGLTEYWMSFEAADDYRSVHARSGSQVWVVLHDASAAGDGTRWLRAPIMALFDSGRREPRTTSSGEVVAALVWPADCMDVIVGPRLDLDTRRSPILPEEGDGPSVPLSDLAPIERRLRRPARDESAVEDRVPPGIRDVIRHDAQAGLDVLRQQLGVPSFPRYSVLRIGLDSLDIDEILGLTRYGIRVFLVSGERPEIETDDDRIAALMDARLLEWSIVPNLGSVEGWWVDGRGLDSAGPEVRDALDRADAAGGINLGQYLIVHADHSTDILVTAGAGTGKTETMSERLVYLLATSNQRAEVLERRFSFDLRLDDIALITFTREAASEMRRRVAQTLMLRQRLCDRCVLPATPWLMQLSATDIDTIHSYAKKIIQRDGSLVGITPGFRISPQTMGFRRLVQRALSEHLGDLYDSDEGDQVPPEFEFVRFVEEIWHRLSSLGLSPMQLVPTDQQRRVEWGSGPPGVERLISNALQSVVDEVGVAFKGVCFETQQIPIGELVSTATSVVERSGGALRRRPRHVFIDEFQDTDAEQMDMILSLRRRVGSRLFVVGDEKQGIYRFRGAQGSAFKELETRVSDLGMDPLSNYTLTKNFRSGRTLLDSMHPWFVAWSQRGLLNYSPEDRLEAGRLASDTSSEVEIRRISANAAKEREVVKEVKGWLRSNPKASIAVLCRRNSEAQKFQSTLRAEGIPCELSVGGNFFQSPAVKDARVLLEAVLHPDDDAALLELCETRWFSGLATSQAPADLPAEYRELWGAGIRPMLSWRDRLASSRSTGTFERDDLEILRKRIRCLCYLLEHRPTLAWIVECSTMMQPKRCRLPGDQDDIDLQRYARCLDHLIAMMDQAFEDSPISPHLVLSWLRLQIATNNSEDEPDPDSNSIARVIALTVHKSKGLEFDYVILPATTASFGPQRSQNEIAVVANPDGSARLLWRWRPGDKSGEQGFRNWADRERRLWNVERNEVAREEARLLYVAMTRAKSGLVVFAPEAVLPAEPNTWRDLMNEVTRDGR